MTANGKEYRDCELLKKNPSSEGLEFSGRWEDLYLEKVDETEVEREIWENF